MDFLKNIPTFPEFKSPDTSDKVLFDGLTLHMGVYSDFNFYSFFTWNTKATHAISQLNGNLIAKFSDYTSDEIFLSIIGTNDIENCVAEIFHHCRNTSQLKILSLVPEPTAIMLSESKKFTIEEDRSNHDYVYCLRQLADLKGKPFKNKRQLANKFIQLNELEIKKVNINDLNTQVEIFDLLTDWNKTKLLSGKESDLHFEQFAILRMVKYSQNEDSLLTHAAYIDNKMVGFSVDELLPHDHVLSHYFKTTPNAPSGVTEYFNQQLAIILLKKGYQLWNWEQDLGLQGLQTSKLSYRPIQFQKKFTILENT
jgi:hypothetical protein